LIVVFPVVVVVVIEGLVLRTHTALSQSRESTKVVMHQTAAVGCVSCAHNK